LSDVKVYLTEAEKAWVKKQDPGVIRWCVQQYMKKYPAGIPKEED
jgi:hypothetical protein